MTVRSRARARRSAGTGRATVAAALVGSVLLGAAVPALAQESGTVTYLSSYVRDYTTIELGDFEAFGGPLRGTTTILNSSGGPFVEGENSLITCLVYGKRTAAGVELESACESTDSSGDLWFTLAIRGAGDVEVGGGGLGRRELLGGTGKYAGVTGSCTYTTHYLGNDRTVTVTTCDWSMQ